METQRSGMGAPTDDLPAAERKGDDFDPPVTETVVVNDPKTYDPPS